MLAIVKNSKDVHCFNGTTEHIENVKSYMQRVITVLQKRASEHDKSKLKDPEFESFSKFMAMLPTLTYGSEEYDQNMKELEPALIHHYANNRHHPEHFKNGIKDMNLIDIIEMFVDWYCATKKHNDGNIRKSLEINQKRFKISNELIQIMTNTIETFDSM